MTYFIDLVVSNKKEAVSMLGNKDALGVRIQSQIESTDSLDGIKLLIPEAIKAINKSVKEIKKTNDPPRATIK